MVKPEQVIALLSHRFQLDLNEEKKATTTTTYQYLQLMKKTTVVRINGSPKLSAILDPTKIRTHTRQNNTTQYDVSIIGNQSNKK